MSAELIKALALAMGASWLSGIRLTGALLTFGILERTGYAHFPAALQPLASTNALIALSVLFIVELLADKVPYVDAIWHTVAGFLRIPAGALLASASFDHYDPGVKVAALIMGGGITATSFGAKGASKAVINVSPEPVSNIVVSLIEDGIVVASAVLMVVAPIVVIAAVALLTLAGILVIRKALKLRRAKRLANEGQA